MKKLDTFYDVLLIEEIPEKDSLTTGVDGIIRAEKHAKDPQFGKVVSADTRFPFAGVWVDMPYKVGDIVKTDVAQRRYVKIDPEDEKPGAKRYFLIRYHDIRGRLTDESLS